MVTFSNIPLLLKPKPINTLRSITNKHSKDRASIKHKNDRCINGMFVFAIRNLVHALNRISKSARENCARPP